MDIFDKITIDKDSHHPLYLQLFNQIKDFIEKKEVPSEYKLPPIRRLASQLNINNVTVVNAYKLLEQKDYVYSKVGSGTYVAEINSFCVIDDDNNPELESEELKLMDQGQIRIGPDTINFASATPSPELFPVDDFKDVINEILDRDKGFAFGYQESQGFYPLRESIAAYLQENGSYVQIEDIQIISGAQQGIDILSKSLLEFGDSLIVESPTYTGAIAAFKSRGAQIIEVPIANDGINLDMLEDKIKKYRPKFIYLMPNFQNPTGYCYSLAKRKEVLRLANKYDILIVEDDYLSELNYNNERKLVSLKSLDTENRVIYIKSFSKIFMPGLRLAFLVVPKSIYGSVLAAKHTTDISTSGLIQRSFDLYLRKGFWKKHINYMQNIFKERYEVMVDSLEKYMPEEVSFFKTDGGLTIWLSNSKKISIYKLYNDCLLRDVLFTPGSTFYPTPKRSNNLRLSFAACYPDAIGEGIKIMSKAIKNIDKEDINYNSYSPLL